MHPIRLMNITAFALSFVALSCSVSTAFAQDPIQPISDKQRFQWALQTSVSPARMGGSLISSAFSTWTNQPEEFGPGWSGYGKRFATRIATGAMQNYMEAGVASIWDEDPRYIRRGSGSIGSRIGYAMKMTVLARRSDGSLMPAYARYVAITAASGASMAYRPASERTAGQFTIRIPMSLIGRAAGNSFSEFWPDVSSKLRR
ncbi:hypothetical protein F183_A18960 [Bryobacterales bacterium F-183]|nr:hypothetical protein F183_A18960 [Bryobacterales bacterium F-183]